MAALGVVIGLYNWVMKDLSTFVKAKKHIETFTMTTEVAFLSEL